MRRDDEMKKEWSNCFVALYFVAIFWTIFWGIYGGTSLADQLAYFALGTSMPVWIIIWAWNWCCDTWQELGGPMLLFFVCLYGGIFAYVVNMYIELFFAELYKDTRKRLSRS